MRVCAPFDPFLRFEGVLGGFWCLNVCMDICVCVFLFLRAWFVVVNVALSKLDARQRARMKYEGERRRRPSSLSFNSTSTYICSS